MKSLELRSRRFPDRVQPFQPADHPELWSLTHDRKGIRGLREAHTSDVLKMFVPRAIRGDLPLRQADHCVMIFPDRAGGKFMLQLDGEDKYDLELDARVEPAKAGASAMLSVSDYSANWPTEKGTQAFYHNLEYQLGHMDIPVIFGQKVPWSLGFFVHRVGQVPVALLDDSFRAIRERMQDLCKCTQADMMSQFSAFSFTAQVYGETPASLVDPKYLPVLAELQKKFDAMYRQEREAKYPELVKEAFHLS